MSTTLEQAIEAYVLLGKNAKGDLAAKKLIVQAIQDPFTIVFGELFNVECVQGIRSEKEFHLLNLFAFGTYMDYKRDPSKFPKLTSGNLRKLKKLTVLTLSSQSKSISYKDLLSLLDLATTRELEDLLIECFNQNLLTGKLDQKLAYFEVTHVVSRDVQKKDVKEMVTRLARWVQHSENMLSEMKILFDKTQEEFEVHARREKAHKDEVDEIEKTIKAAKIDEMDLPNDRRRRRRFPK